MPYSQPYDISTPTPTSTVRLGDDAIRELKEALEERLATIMNFPAGEPLALNTGAIASRAPLAAATKIAWFEIGSYDLAPAINVPAGDLIDITITIAGITALNTALPSRLEAFIILNGPLVGAADEMLHFRITREFTGAGGTPETHLQLVNYTAAMIATVARTLAIGVIRAV